RVDDLGVARERRLEAGLEEELREADHAIGRGAELVADVGEELRLRPVRALGPLAQGPEAHLHALAPVDVADARPEAQHLAVAPGDRLPRDGDPPQPRVLADDPELDVVAFGALPRRTEERLD